MGLSTEGDLENLVSGLGRSVRGDCRAVAKDEAVAERGFLLIGLVTRGGKGWFVRPGVVVAVAR